MWWSLVSVIFYQLKWTMSVHIARFDLKHTCMPYFNQYNSLSKAQHRWYYVVVQMVTFYNFRIE